MIEIVRTACPLDCWDNCVWLVTVEDGVVRSVRGDPDHPVTRGFACSKAQEQLKRLYGPERILRPMVRDGGTFRAISWDEAIDTLASAMIDAREKAGPESVLHYSDAGSSGWTKDCEDRFFELFGGVTVPRGSLCWGAGLKAQEYDFGDRLAHSPGDIVNSRLIILWGRNPAWTNRHLLPFLKEASRRGARIVLIDPVRTATAGLADLHLAPLPGTDGALAMGMAKVIVEEGLYDEDFVRQRTEGFESFRRELDSFTLEEAAGAAGLEGEAIASLAREYAGIKPAAILLGYGLQRYRDGGNTIRSIDALGALCGNIGVRGGGVNYANRAISRLRGKTGRRGDREARYREFPRTRFGEFLEKADPPVEVAVVTRSNPLSQVPDSAKVRRGFARVPLKAVIDVRWSETAEAADIVLPATTVFEEEDVYSCSWHPYVTYGARCIQPRGEALPEVGIFARLAAAMGFGEEFPPEPRAWIREGLRPLIGEQPLEEYLGRSFPCPGVEEVPWRGAFATPSGRFEFRSELAERDGHPAVPVFPRARVTPEGFPLVLITPQHSKTIHSQFFEATGEAGRPAVWLSPQTARELGLEDGQEVQVRTFLGSAAAVCRTREGQSPGAAVMYSGGPVNRLVPAVETDFNNGAAFYECFCRIEKT